MKKGFTRGAAALAAAGVAAVAAAAAQAAPGTTIVRAVRSAAAARAVVGTSTNWAGYAVTGTTFTDVKGSWVQPSVTCPARGSTYSAFWVGLGGYAGGSTALEQIGTEADCRAGQPVYSVWYELVPAPVVDVPMTVSPGDAVTAEVSVSGTTVTLSLADTTSGATYSQQATVANPDLSSAEWVAEAPSQCARSLRNCSVLPLASFGTVAFSGAATTGNGTVGTISDAAWTAQGIQLGGRFGTTTATPSALSPDGSGFSVTTSTAPAPTATPVPRGRGGWSPWSRARGRGRRWR